MLLWPWMFRCKNYFPVSWARSSLFAKNIICRTTFHNWGCISKIIGNRYQRTYISFLIVTGTLKLSSVCEAPKKVLYLKKSTVWDIPDFLRLEDSWESPQFEDCHSRKIADVSQYEGFWNWTAVGRLCQQYEELANSLQFEDHVYNLIDSVCRYVRHSANSTQFDDCIFSSVRPHIPRSERLRLSFWWL